MGEERFGQHLKQIVSNISYEYQDGRLSGIAFLNLVIEKLPRDLLQRHSQHLFLPLVLQLVNDDSKDCRVEVSNCISTLLKRSSVELLQTFQDYCSRWSKQTGPLRLASLQVFGLLVESRAEFLKSKSLVDLWIQRLEEALYKREESDWEDTYFALICVEKLTKDFNSNLLRHSKLMTSIIECLINPHPWIKMSSSRILNHFFTSNSAEEFLSQKNGILFEIVRNILFQFNVSEEEQSQDLSDLGVKTLTLALPLMVENPQFCYAEENLIEKESTSENVQDPVFWLLRRLSQIAKAKGSKRRMTVFKCYAAFTISNFAMVAPNLELMLEGLHRSNIEAKNEIENQELSQRRTSSSFSNDQHDAPVTEHSFAEEVLSLIEEKCTSSSDFLNAYAEVKRRAYNKKQRRKTEQKIEAATNPQAAADRRMKKQERNKRRKKRRSEEQARERRGGEKKYRHN